MQGSSRREVRETRWPKDWPMTLAKIVTEGRAAQRPVDEIPPLKRLLPLAVQHVLAMYAGAVAVPLIVGGAMVAAGQLQQSDIVHLIMADLFVAGIATIIQAVGFWRFGCGCR